tara:strand:+ start:363 stop:581 length:219 start_codon:yes stop_codon:yes gene_type:complete
MSNIHNTAILERIAEDVEKMSAQQIVNEALDRPESMWGTSPMSDSWDECFAMVDMDRLKDKVVFKRFEAMGE